MDKTDNKSSIAGGISAFMAIGTGAVGITAVVINSVECLAVSLIPFISCNGFCYLYCDGLKLKNNVKR